MEVNMNNESNPESISISFEEYTRLKHTEDFYNAIFEESPFILVINDVENEKYIHGNRFFCDQVGLTKEEFIGKTASELGLGTDAESHKEMLRIFQRDGCLHGLERTYQLRDGSMRDYLIWTNIIGIKEKKYAFTIMQDITESNTHKNELKASESKYRGLYMQMLDSFIRTDMDGIIIEANEAFLKLTGYTMPELNKMNILDLTPLSFLVVGRDIFIEQIQKRGYSDLYQKEYVRKDGTLVPVELRTYLEVDKQGQPVSMWAIVRDISIRQKAFTELKASQVQLRALASRIQDVREEEKISIAREIHDDLGHLLTAVKHDLEEISGSQATSDWIEEKLNPIISLVDSCIDTARKISYDLHPGILDHFGLIPALEWMIDQFRIRAKIKCVLSLPEVLPEFNKKESIVVFRIFQEILTNITRHSKANEIEIGLSHSSDKAIFIITDNGIGFNIISSQNNISLGLLSMKERALSIDAGFSIESAPGKGTIIKIQLKKPDSQIETS